MPHLFSGDFWPEGLKPVSRETYERLKVYQALLEQWQKRINLVSPTTIPDSWERHFLDSVQNYDLLDDSAHLVDIGCGAGFPGLVLAICMAGEGKNDRQRMVDLVESNVKKCAFMRTVVRETGLNGTSVQVRVHQERIENCLPHLKRPDVVTARALAPLDKLFELTKSHLTKGATGLFAKGRDVDSELKQARQDWTFDVEQHPSLIDSNSTILKIRNLQAKG